MIFGVYLDEVPTINAHKYQGSPETFLFTLEPKVEQYPALGTNDFYYLCASKYLTIGANGDGPAIRLDELLKKGRSYSCETFDNPSFSGRTEGPDKERYDIEDIELHLL